MQCPKCQEGNIRVIEGFVCTCGHHALICDKCFSCFAVECGSPSGASKLPPKYKMEEDLGLTESFQEVMDDGSDKVAFVEKFPLLDDFKKKHGIGLKGAISRVIGKSSKR